MDYFRFNGTYHKGQPHQLGLVLEAAVYEEYQQRTPLAKPVVRQQWYENQCKNMIKYAHLIVRP